MASLTHKNIPRSYDRGIILLFQNSPVRQVLTMHEVFKGDSFVVMANQLILAPDAEYTLRHGKIAADEFGQHLQQYIGAAGIIAIADQILGTGSVDAVHGVCKQMHKAVIMDAVIGIGFRQSIVLQEHNADGSTVVHHPQMK